MGFWKNLLACANPKADEPASQCKGTKERKAQQQREQQQAQRQEQQQQHEQQQQQQWHQQGQEQQQQHSSPESVAHEGIPRQSASPRSAAPPPTEEIEEGSLLSPSGVPDALMQPPEVAHTAAHTQTPPPPFQLQSSTQTLPAEQLQPPDHAREHTSLLPNSQGHDVASQTQPPHPPPEPTQPLTRAEHTQTSPHLFFPPSAPAHTQTDQPPPAHAKDTQTLPTHMQADEVPPGLAKDTQTLPTHMQADEAPPGLAKDTQTLPTHMQADEAPPGLAEDTQTSPSHTQAEQPVPALAKETQTSPRASDSGSDSDLPEHVSLNQVLLEEEQAQPMVSLREAYAQQQERAEAFESMSKQLEERQQQYEALSSDHASLQQQLAAQQQQQQQEQQQHAALATAHASLQQQHGLLKQQHVSAQQQLEFLEHHQSELQRKCVGQQQQLAGLRASHARLQRGLGDLHMLLHSLGLLAHENGSVQDGHRVEDQDHDGACATDATSLQLAQIAAGCKAQKARAADYEARQEQLTRQLEAARVERASVQQSYNAAFDAGEAARVQVLQLREELDSLRSAQQPFQTPSEQQSTERAATQNVLEAASAKSAALEVKLQEKERQMHALRMEQERAVEEQQRLRQQVESAEAATQALKQRLEESERETAHAQKEVDQLAAALSSNDLVNAHTAGQTDALLKDYVQLKEKHLALLTEMDAKHNMIELLAHQFEEVEGPDLRAVSAHTKGGGRTSTSTRSTASRANGGS